MRASNTTLKRAELEELFPLEQRPEPLLSQSGKAVLDHVYEPLEHADISVQQRVRNARLFAAGASVEALVSRLLPVLDSLDSLLKQIPSLEIEGNDYFDNWIRALQASYKKMLKALEREGLEPLESEGLAVDLALHDVLEVIPREGVTEARVIKEEEKGYRFRDRIIRDAKVIAEVPVNNNSDAVTEGGIDNPLLDE
jgi:molecular chaperone GrpE (heat shock protein)